MLSLQHRIPRKDFGPLLKSRIFAHSPHFSLRFADSTGVRVAVSVSKKVSKSAVVRNTIRRRMYALVRDVVPTMRPGLFLFIAKPKAETVKGEALKAELSTLLKSL